MSTRLPFSAAIFDLDGTLLDSMYVWTRIDEIFFESRGMEIPEDYGHALAGKSYRESAEYTIERFGLSQSWEEIVKEWTDLAIAEYAHHVQLKPGALKYLRALKRAGVKLAVATALPEYLYRPCLEHCGILNMFDALCSTDDTGGRGKRDGEVFLLAASRIGANPSDCIVFEDVPDGLRGAKKAGMLACGVRDSAGKKGHADMASIADHTIDSFDELERPDVPRRCAIFTACCAGDPAAAYEPREGDLVLCADRGYELAEKMGIMPDCIIGDFDSAAMPAGKNVIRHPVIKDDTDTMLCVRYALDRGIEDILIVGGIGGRIDHTLANLQTLAFIAARGARAELCDGKIHAYMISGGQSICIPAAPGKLSVFAHGGTCSGVCIRGTKYEAENTVITPDFPIGMGNDFAAGHAEVSVESGMLLVICELEKE